MGKALRLDELDWDFAPPAALREPPPFVARDLPESLVADLQRRAALAREFSENTKASSTELMELAEDACRIIDRKTVYTSSIPVRLIRIEAEIRSSMEPLIERYESLRLLAEMLDGTARAAWLGYVDPMLSALHQQLDTGMLARRRLSAHVKNVLGYDYDLWLGESEDERLLNYEAAVLYRRFAERDLGLPCSVGWIEECGIPFNELTIHVPAGTVRPHRVYHAALDRVHDAVESINPRLVGRMTFTFLRPADAH